MDKQEKIQLAEEMGQPEIRCVRCESPFIRKRGYQYYKDGSIPKQKYSCNDCGKYFVLEPSHYNPSRKVPKQLRKIILSLHGRNYTIQQIKIRLTKKFDFKISNMTIWRNIHKY